MHRDVWRGPCSPAADDNGVVSPSPRWGPMTASPSRDRPSKTGWVLAAITTVIAFVLAIPLVMLNGAGTGNGEPRPGEVPEPYVAHVREAGTRCPDQGVSAPVIAAQIYAESAWNPQAVSPVGAQGLAQFMPGTWTTWGTDYDQDGTSSPLDPPDAIGSQADYMCYLATWVAEHRQEGVIDGDPLNLTLAAYNAGPANVETHGGIPPFTETRGYIATIRELIPLTTITHHHEPLPHAQSDLAAQAQRRIQ